MFTFDFTHTQSPKEELLDSIFDILIELIGFDKAEEALEEISTYSCEELNHLKKEAEKCLLLNVMNFREVVDLNDIFGSTEE